MPGYERLWTIEYPGPPIRPAEVVWEAESAAPILREARVLGYVVRGPYVLESRGQLED